MMTSITAMTMTTPKLVTTEDGVGVGLPGCTPKVLSQLLLFKASKLF